MLIAVLYEKTRYRRRPSSGGDGVGVQQLLLNCVYHQLLNCVQLALAVLLVWLMVFVSHQWARKIEYRRVDRSNDHSGYLQVAEQC